jgi:hypothetical protein
VESGGGGIYATDNSNTFFSKVLEYSDKISATFGDNSLSGFCRIVRI